MAKESRIVIQRAVPIAKEKLHPNPWNPNKLNARTTEALGESLAFFGQVQEILARPHPSISGEFEVIDGEHRYHQIEGDIFINIITGLTEAEAQKLTVVMDETRGDLDKIELSALLDSLQHELGEDLGLGLPYDADELERLVKLSEVDWDNFGSSDNSEESPEEDSSTNISASDAGLSGFTSVTLEMDEEAIDRLNQVKSLTRKILDLPEDEAQALGMVVSCLCKEYLGGF